MSTPTPHNCVPGEWQPISSAPKDGSQFIGIGAGNIIKIWQWCRDEYAKKPRPFFRTYGYSVTHDRATQPTHWMPLPEPPVTT